MPSAGRGGLSTKVHQLVDGKRRPLVIALTAGQAGDSPVLKMLLADLAVARNGAGRPRTRPEALLGDKAYSSRANRDLLRNKRVKAVIPQRATRSATGEDAAQPAAATHLRRHGLQRPQRRRAAPSTTTSNGAASQPATTSSAPTTEEA